MNIDASRAQLAEKPIARTEPANAVVEQADLHAITSFLLEQRRIRFTH